MAPAAPTMTVTSKFDQRLSDAERFPAWEIVLNGLWDADDTADGTLNVKINGILQKIILKVPDTTNNVTGQVVIKDNGDNTIFDSGEKAEAVTYPFSVNEPVTGTVDVIMGISAASGTAVTNMVVTLRGI
ncbi:hypothetical protein LCGC14_0345660 [marine sediment metagenome]|uniref:BppU N-terminal domain-containing protein n=1 Tax=marine sediment metagenome TaxID=412755 RepID=A0A0F9THU0_9ZZZZ